MLPFFTFMRDCANRCQWCMHTPNRQALLTILRLHIMWPELSAVMRRREECRVRQKRKHVWNEPPYHTLKQTVSRMDGNIDTQVTSVVWLISQTVIQNKPNMLYWCKSANVRLEFILGVFFLPEHAYIIALWSRYSIKRYDLPSTNKQNKALTPSVLKNEMIKRN